MWARPDDLAALLEGDPDEAAARFCAAQRCTREALTAGPAWFLPAGSGRVLEIGGGIDGTLALAAAARAVTSLAPGEEHARLLRRHLDARGAPNVEVHALADLARLPLADASCAAVVVDDAALAAFDVAPAGLSLVAAGWSRVLEPNGTLLLTLAGSVERWLALAGVRGEPTLDRVVWRLSASRPLRLGLGRASRLVRRAGFAEPSVWAPLPGRDRVSVVLPIADRQAVGYFLDHMVRRNAPVVRAGIGLARLANAAGVLPRLVPRCLLVCRA